MMSKERVLARERQRGRAAAREVQTKAPDMNGTELYAVDDRIPAFKAACAKMNMLGRLPGFVCKSSAGRVVRLLQPYDSTIYTQEPEDLPDYWGFVWSTDPAKALPFLAIDSSPYNTGDCCTADGVVYRSNVDGNTLSPAARTGSWSVYDGGDGQ